MLTITHTREAGTIIEGTSKGDGAEFIIDGGETAGLSHYAS